MNIKIKTITIQIGKKEINLTLEEARSLKTEYEQIDEEREEMRRGWLKGRTTPRDELDEWGELFDGPEQGSF